VIGVHPWMRHSFLHAKRRLKPLAGLAGAWPTPLDRPRLLGPEITLQWGLAPIAYF